MESQPTQLDKAVKISIIAGALITALSIAYYLVIFMPKKEAARVERQNQEDIIRLEKEAQQKEDRLKAECVEEKKGATVQYHKALDECTTNKCTEFVIKELEPDNNNYISNCLDRKLKGLPTFGY